MNVLIVASYNKNRYAPFIDEQANALKVQGIAVDYFRLKGKGIIGYLKNLKALKQKIKAYHPDIVHAHFGLSGLLACLQRKVPVVTTYHGSDVNEPKLRPFSKLAMRLSAWNIFVSQQNIAVARPSKNYTLLPCGIDSNSFPILSKQEARQKMNFDDTKKYVLFAGAFSRPVKNAPLAQQVIRQMNDSTIVLLELNNWAHDEIPVLMSAVDALLMTSLNEGSPQVIKEVMMCGCPIVSVDVGDVKERTEGVDGCYVANTFSPDELTVLLSKALKFNGKTSGREKIIGVGLDNQNVAKKLIEIYAKVR